MLVHILANWLVSALALWLVAQIVPGIEVRDFGAALFATIVDRHRERHHRAGCCASSPCR